MYIKRTYIPLPLLMRKSIVAISITSALLLSGCTTAPVSDKSDTTNGAPVATTPLTYSNSAGRVIVEMSFPDNWKKISVDETGKETLVPITTLENMTRYTDGTPENTIYLTMLPPEYLETYKDWKNALVQLYLIPKADDLQAFYADAGHKGPGYEYTGPTSYKVGFWNIDNLVVLEMPKKNDIIDKIVGSVSVKF